jgi:outer membrane protein assembly factor BamA|tara:strand:+ start:4346 stop:5755 length:1410 start_codon:yes stop_codon:yes gene_type:complete
VSPSRKLISFFLIIICHCELAAQKLAEPSGIYIEKIYLLGNDKTKAEIIFREMNLKEGYIYPKVAISEMINRDKLNIANTSLFNDVSIEPLNISLDTLSLLVKVSERWYFFPSPILKFADRNLMDWLINREGDLSRFNYGFKLMQFNIRGKNQTLKFVGQVGFERNLMVNYSLPYIEKTQKHGLSFMASYSEAKNISYVTKDHLNKYFKSDQNNKKTYSTGITYSFRPSYYDTHHLRLDYQHGSISDTIQRLNTNYYGASGLQQQFFKLSYAFTRDVRDKRLYATNGYFIQAKAEKTGLNIFDDVNVFLIKATFNKYTPFGNGYFMANGFKAVLSYPNVQPYNNYQNLGYGTNVARGFELNVIEGPKYFIQQNSFRKKIFEHEKDFDRLNSHPQFNKFKIDTYAKIFADLAWVENYPNYEISSRLTNQWLYSIGVGLDLLMIYDLVLRLEYSYNSQNDLNFAVNIRADL